MRTCSGASHSGNAPAKCSIKTPMNRSIDPKGARIEDVALAADQLDFTHTPTSGSFIDNIDRIVLHGGIVGVERQW